MVPRPLRVVLAAFAAIAAAALLVAAAGLTSGAGSSAAEREAAEVAARYALERETVGASVQGRPIDVQCFGAGTATALFVGGLHTGPEANTVQLARQVLERLPAEVERLPASVRVCVVPVLNPDGVANGDHGNAAAVDLNRNWPTEDWEPYAHHPTAEEDVRAGSRPLSEPETAALHRLLTELRPSVLVTWHCCGSVVEANEAGAAGLYARTYASGAGYTYLDEWTLYPITGQLIDAAEALGIPAMDVELSAVGETDLERSLDGLRALLHLLARYTGAAPLA